MPNESDRYLRHPDLRAALYEAADGRCAVCKKPLETGWHADHIVPWVVSKTTNIYEMQALCPECNMSKGSKMTNDWLNIKHENLRIGQRNAISYIVSKVRQGEKSVAVVLPPGYGKSDVIRVSSVMLMLQNQVSRALILSRLKPCGAKSLTVTR